MIEGFDPEFAAASDWARLYRANGVQIVPCKNKSPRLKSWKEYQNALVPDAQFEAWYGLNGEFHNSYDMGMLTGAASGRILMIDLDRYKPGGNTADRWWQSVLDVHENGMEPETWKQRTGGGGIQMFFLYPKNWKFAVNAKTDINVDIRCQGGFAVLPPTKHASGHTYSWVEGYSPWEIPIATAPDWLLEEVEKLIREHGGGQASAGNGAHGQADRTAQGTFDAFGHQTDGREDKMYKQIWAALVGLRIDSPIPPGMLEEKAIWAEYERGTEVQELQPGETKLQGLEREHRGTTEFHKKWLYTLKKWDTEIADAAKERAAKENAKLKHELKVDPTTGQPLPLILTGVDFLKAFKPPDYLIDGVMQRSGLYAVTARTGHGKTAVAMLTAFCVARGVPFHGKPTEQGSVLFFAGENSDDIRARYTVMLDDVKANVADVPLYFIDGVINIQSDMARIRSEAASIPNLSMVIIDTKQAYFLGDDGNSNEQQVQFARLGRELIKLPGHPSVVFLCHPIKNAGRDNLVPMGGSAFLNEIDFNFTLWAEDKVCKLNPHPDKWRGPVFEELAFELKQQSSIRLRDSKGREIPSVIAVPISEMSAERREAVADDDEKQILRLIHADKNASFTRLAERAGWKQLNGDLAKSKVARVITRLRDSKFVYRFHGNKYRLTKKGCRHVGLPYGNSEDDDE